MGSNRKHNNLRKTASPLNHLFTIHCSWDVRTAKFVIDTIKLDHSIHSRLWCFTLLTSSRISSISSIIFSIKFDLLLAASVLRSQDSPKISIFYEPERRTHHQLLTEPPISLKMTGQFKSWNDRELQKTNFSIQIIYVQVLHISTLQLHSTITQNYRTTRNQTKLTSVSVKPFDIFPTRSLEQTNKTH